MVKYISDFYFSLVLFYYGTELVTVHSLTYAQPSEFLWSLNDELTALNQLQSLTCCMYIVVFATLTVGAVRRGKCLKMLIILVHYFFNEDDNLKRPLWNEEDHAQNAAESTSHRLCLFLPLMGTEVYVYYVTVKGSLDAFALAVGISQQPL